MGFLILPEMRISECLRLVPILYHSLSDHYYSNCIMKNKIKILRILIVMCAGIFYHPVRVF